MPRSDSIQVRALGPADLAGARALLSMFGTAFADPTTYGGAPPRAEYLERLLGSETFIALVAEVGTEVVGGLAAYELRKLERERSEIYLYDLAVAEPYRRRGIATALIRELQKLASERDAWVIFVQADYADPPAIALYEKLGTREEVLHFDLPVERRRAR